MSCAVRLLVILVMVAGVAGCGDEEDPPVSAGTGATGDVVGVGVEDVPLDAQRVPLTALFGDDVAMIELSAGSRPWTGAAVVLDESGEWRSLSGLPPLQHPTVTGGAAGLVLVGLSCPAEPPCEQGRPTVAWMLAGEDSWQVVELPAEEQTSEAYDLAAIGTDGAVAWASTSADLWRVDQDGAEVVTQLPPSARLACVLPDGAVIVGSETGPELTNEEVDAAMLRPIELHTLDADRVEWRPVPGGLLDQPPQFGQPGCAGSTPYVVAPGVAMIWTPGGGWRGSSPNTLDRWNVESVTSDGSGRLVITAPEGLVLVHDPGDGSWRVASWTPADGPPPGRAVFESGGDFYLHSVTPEGAGSIEALTMEPA